VLTDGWTNDKMRFRLRTLLIVLAFLPAAIALAWWACLFALGSQPHPTLVAFILVAHFASWLAAPLLWWSELDAML
jgi:hypothetical protein